MDAPLVRNPVYVQINDRLRGLVSTEFRPTERFLTERQVSERYQVSRATANKALASLVSEGLLEFRKGIGTFVRGDVIDYDLRSLMSFTEKARAAGRTPETRVLHFTKTPAADAPPEIGRALGCTGRQVLWSMVRLRLVDGTPVILENRLVVAAHCPRLTRRQAAGSLFAAWTEGHALRIAAADETIRAIALAKEEAEPLAAAIGGPALEVVSTGFLEGGEPLWWERTLYRGDAYEFRNRLGPVRHARPTVGTLRS